MVININVEKRVEINVALAEQSKKLNEALSSNRGISLQASPLMEKYTHPMWGAGRWWRLS